MEINELVSYMKQDPAKIVPQHVAVKMSDLISAVDFCLKNYTKWTVGKRHGPVLIAICRNLKALYLRMINGEGDGRRYKDLTDRVTNMCLELYRLIRQLTRLYKRILV